jgi:hypothetical protein
MAIMTPMSNTMTAMKVTMRMRGFSGGWDIWKADPVDGRATTSVEADTSHHPARANM